MPQEGPLASDFPPAGHRHCRLGHRRTRRRPRCRHGRRSSNGSRKTRPRTAAKGSTISASGGHARAVIWVATLQKGGGAWRWRTRWRVPSTTPTLHSQRAKPSPSWSGLCPGIRIGRGLARIARLLWGKARWGAGIACPPLARRVVAPHGEGEEVEGATPRFLALVRHRGGGGGHAKIHHLPSPFRGRSLHSDPWREGHRALPRSGRINRPVRFPHRRRDLRSLRGESVPGGVSGCSAMPGSEKVQPARQSSRIQGGQDTVERFPVASRAIEASVMGEGEGSGGGDGGARGALSRSGVRRGRSPSPAPMYYIG